DGAAAVNLDELLGDEHVFLRERFRSRLYRRRSGRGFADHGVGVGSGVGAWRLSVRLVPIVWSWPFSFKIMTVSGLVATCVLSPCWTRALPVSSKFPFFAV